jgi:hypothetical protein
VACIRKVELLEAAVPAWGGRSGLVRLAALGRRGVEFLNAGDVQDGTTNPSLGEGLFVQVHSDHDVVAAHDGNVVVRDWVLPAVGHGEKEGLEGHFIEEVSYLSRRDHFFLSFLLFRVRPGPVRGFQGRRI